MVKYLDKNGLELFIGDYVKIGSGMSMLQTEIIGLKVYHGDLMVETSYGDFNASIVEKEVTNG